MRKSFLAILCVAVLLAVIVLSIFATPIVKKEQERDTQKKQEQMQIDKPEYGVDGKEIGSELETEPVMITEDHVYFEDRVLERFHYDTNGILKCSSILSGVMNSLPSNINKYLMLIPMRIGLEEGEYKMPSDDIISAIDEIYKRMPANVTTVDAAGALLAHKDEYVFFRTDHVWTALGAYYAAQEFCTGAGIDMIEIEKYYEECFNKYIGTFHALPNTDSLENYPDYISYYILKGASNEQMITSRRSEEEYIVYKTPTVALSRAGYDIFIGSFFSHSILQGDADNGKTLMILGDEYSKPFAPWLTPYFENVCLVDPSFFKGSSKEFWQLFNEYQITDLLIMEYGKNVGDSIINDRLLEICSVL